MLLWTLSDIDPSVKDFLGGRPVMTSAVTVCYIKVF